MSQVLKKSTRQAIYIIPNRFGFIFFLTFLILLIAAATYQNNLAFMMTFLLFSFGFILMIQTHRNLRDIDVLSVWVESNFAGEKTKLQIALKNQSKETKHNVAIQVLGLEGTGQAETIASGETRVVEILTELPGLRGEHNFEQIYLKSIYPFGLFSAWAPKKFSAKIICFPIPKGSLDLPSEIGREGEDFSGHRPHREGEGMTRVDWKIAARGKGWFTKEYKDRSADQLWIRLSKTPGANLEEKLSQISLWLQSCKKEKIEVGVDLDGQLIQPAKGHNHFQSAWARLASFGNYKKWEPPRPNWPLFRKLTKSESEKPVTLHQKRFVHALLSLAILPTFAEFTSSFNLLASMLICVGFLASYNRLPQISTLVKSLFVLGGFVAIGTLHRWEIFTDSTVNLLIVMALFKSIDIKRQWDAMFVLFTTLIIGMSYLLYEQTLFATVYMFLLVLHVVNAMTFLQIKFEGYFTYLKQWRSVISWDYLVVLPLLLVLFVLFPRFTTPLTKYMDDSRSISGFSGDLRMGEYAKLAQSDERAFRVVFEGEFPNQSDLYWRGTVLTETDGLNWFHVDRPKRFQAEVPLFPTTADALVKYRLFLEPRFKKFMFTLDVPLAVESASPETPVNVGTVQNHVFEFTTAPMAVTEWIGISRLPFNSGDRSESPTENEIRFPKISNKVKNLVAQWKNQSKTPNEISEQIQRFFKSQGFVYNLESPQLRTLDEFLFLTKSGFCEHYASTYSILMRAAGVPSRVVLGFQGAEYNSIGGYFVVKDRHAHAWSEIWFDDRGWVRVDPTSFVADQRLTSESLNTERNWGRQFAWLNSSYRNIVHTWDALNAAYSTVLMHFNFETQSQIMNQFATGKMTRKILLVICAAMLGLVILVWLLFRAKYLSQHSRLDRRKLALISWAENHGVNYRPTGGWLEFAHRVNQLPDSAELKIWNKNFQGFLSAKYDRGA